MSFIEQDQATAEERKQRTKEKLLNFDTIA